MEITFIFHAEYRIQKRKLLKEEVIEALKYPEKTIKKYGKYYYQKKLARGVIEVVCHKNLPEAPYPALKCGA